MAYFVAFVWIFVLQCGACIWLSNRWYPGVYCIPETAYSKIYLVILADIFCAPCIPLCFIFYYKIYKVAKKQAMAIQAQEVALGKATVQTKDIKAAKMMFLVLLFLILSWSPSTLMHFVCKFFPLEDQGLTYKVVFVSMGHLVLFNACVNPLIYAWQSTPFRIAYKEILHLKLTPQEQQALGRGNR